MKKVLVIGGLGQIGSELVVALKEKYGTENVITADLLSRPKEGSSFLPYEQLNVLNQAELSQVIQKHKINIIYHLAAILSAVGEKNPTGCWDVNVNGLYNVLEASREHEVEQIICPSSIAVFGPKTPRKNTPQDTILLPTTMYGVTKVSGELLCDYYVAKFGMDIRGLRYPGLISHKTLPGGGTTDYAVEIFYKAILEGSYTCFLGAKTRLPMMYMDDAIRGTIQLAEAPFDDLKHHSNFNFAAESFSCEELAHEIKKHLPHFKIHYAPDCRQKIADSWPECIDDHAARSEWHWKHEFGLKEIVESMLQNLQKKLKHR